MKELIIIAPFFVGLTYLLFILFVRGLKWVRGLSKIDRFRLFHARKNKRLVNSIKEIFLEGLIHRSIFKKNKVLGYMHMSLAFGWFLLIVVGHIEVMVARKALIAPVYLPIFFRYFEIGNKFVLSGVFSFLMDLLLLFVLTGLSLAILKRFKKALFGMKKTTRLKTGDKIALTSLWLIFPLRLLAESISAGIHHNGSFLTNSFGSLLNNFQHIEHSLTPAWIAYSLSLGFFFVALPNSRYMHIPTEILLIFFRNAGVKLKKRTNTFTDVQVFSCSRCGLCLDNCQMTTAGINDSQSVYLLKNIRNKSLKDELLFNCLLCGRCQIDCPVGIDIIDLRITQRIESTLQYNSSYTYLEHLQSKKADVIYYAGCMTHLTPGIIKSMKAIFAAAREDYWFLDEEKAACCGRPLMLAGQHDAASILIENNTEKILGSGAKKLVVSCPICYKVFKEDYDLNDVEVVFHIEYILDLISSNKLALKNNFKRLIYHDPCELGRSSGMYEQPRELLQQIGTLIPLKKEKEEALCCGGSLGNLKIKQAERDLLLNQAMNEYSTYTPDIMVTSCPMCKKTFSRNKDIPLMDISEIVYAAL
jgi:Fe-S oxidoreductase